MATKYEYQGGKYTLEKIIKMYLNRVQPAYESMEYTQGDMFVSDLGTLIRARCDLENIIVQIERIKKEKKTSKVAYQYDNDDRLHTSVSLDDASVTRFKSLDEEGVIGINDLKIPDRY
jgi:uridine kinase